ncbi:hypothetical protein KBT16_14470 [Nostoc sp. CCCryo 231-06]|nr:hypothetical protein [Nostoc sp. CCCryo 231-06]
MTDESRGSLIDQVEELNYQVVHKNEQRLRIFLPRLAEDLEYSQTIKRVIESFNLVTDVRINSAAKSIAIEYKTEGVSSSFIQEEILTCIELSLSEDLSKLDLAINPPAVAKVDRLQQIVGYEIVHKNPRRIRISIPRLAADAEYVRTLKYLVESIDSVIEVRINPVVSSIAVEYDYQVDAQAIAKAEQKLFAAIQEAIHVQIHETAIQKATETESNHEINYWERLGPSVVSMVLSFGAFIGLPFPGVLIAGAIFFASIPVFQRAWEGFSIVLYPYKNMVLTNIHIQDFLSMRKS